jgi:hypothetical protein
MFRTEMSKIVHTENTLCQAYFAVCTLHNFGKVQNIQEKIFFGTEVNSEAFWSISQNLKVVCTRLQGGITIWEQSKK